MTSRACGNIGFVAQSHRMQSGAARSATGNALSSFRDMQSYLPFAVLARFTSDQFAKLQGGSAMITSYGGFNAENIKTLYSKQSRI
jgi:hypothetical protein